MYNLRKTSSSKIYGINRVMLGIMFMMTGFMKLALPDYGHAWSIQLHEAGFPFYELIYWGVPIVEFIIGTIILLGYYARIGALLVIPIMVVAVYVHLTVTDPGAFPSQPQMPIMPVIALMMAGLLWVRGSGSWSFDIQTQLRKV